MKLALITAIAVSVGCGVNLPAHEGDVITCASNHECPSGWTCDPDFGACVPPNATDTVAPSIISTSLTPTRGGPGTVFSARVVVNEPLGRAPIIGFQGKTDILTFGLDGAFPSDERTFAMAYTADGINEAEGTTALTLDVFDLSGNHTNAPFGASITFDTTPPSIGEILAVTPTSIHVSFGEQIERVSAETVANYAITPSLTIIDAVLESDGQTVSLITDQQSPGFPYQLTINGVRDVLGSTDVDLVKPFNGFGIGPDATPPDVLSPDDGLRMLRGTVGLIWSERANAVRYHVQVARDAAFTVSAGLDVDVDASVGTTTTLTLSEVGTYYWRVSADTTTSTPPTQRIEVLDDPIYVACAADITCETGAGGGTLDNPLQDIGTALQVAGDFGVTTVLIASRGADATYVGSISIPPGVTLRGGYDTTFADATRDPVGKPTIIEGSGGQVVEVTGASAAAVTLDGLTIRASANMPAALVAVGSPQLNVSNCTIQSSTNNGVSYGVYLIASGGSSGPVPTFSNVTIKSGPASQDSVAIFSEGSALNVQNSTLTSDTSSGGTSAGIEGTFGSFISVSNTTIQAAGGVISSGVTSSAVNGGGSTAVSGCHITTADGQDVSGIASTTTGVASVTSNTITVGNATARGTGIGLTAGGAITVQDNIVTTGSGGLGQKAISIQSSTSFAVERNHVAVGLGQTPSFTDLTQSNFVNDSVGIVVADGATGVKRVVRNVVVLPSDPTGSCTLVGISSTANASVIADNLITTTGGTSRFNVGIAADQANMVIANNTIVAGSTTDTAVGISYTRGNQFSTINNQVLFLSGSTSTRVLFGDYVDSGFPVSSAFKEFRNNLGVFVNPAETDLYDFSDTATSSTASIDNQLFDICYGGCTFSGNLTKVGGVSGANVMFVDPTGSDADPNNDFAPAASNPGISAGRNLYNNATYGSLTTNQVGTARQPCGSASCDASTPAWTIGAE